jgi:hypothetical protein
VEDGMLGEPNPGDDGMLGEPNLGEEGVFGELEPLGDVGAMGWYSLGNS